MTDRPDPAERFLESIRGRLTELHDIGRGRRLGVAPGIDFASNDYLGLAQETQAEKLGGSTGSRLLSGHSTTWERCEQQLARWHAPDGELRALYFPSGYVANEGLLSTLIEAGDLVFSDALNHGSIIDGLRLSRAEVSVFAHQDLAELEARLRQAPPTGRRFVVTESLFGMDGDGTDLQRIASICSEHGALLIVDEAHATGCHGARGSGLVDATGIRDQVFASMHTCGKALGSHGAYVIVAPAIRDYLVQCCRHFIFTTSLPDAVARATMRNVSRCQAAPERRQRLAAHSTRVRIGLSEVFAGRPEFDHRARANILPIQLGSDERAQHWSQALLAAGLRVPPIRSPAVPEGHAILRISLRADHSEAELDRLIEAITTLAATPGA